MQESAALRGSTPRVRSLRDQLLVRGMGDRSAEWFDQEMLPNVLSLDPTLANRSIIIRRAAAFRQMLRALVDPKNSDRTRTFEIRPGELLVGSAPMGSVGLGKEFPGYLTEDEARVASYSHRDVESVFGHNSPDHGLLLSKGLNGIRAEARERRLKLSDDDAWPQGDPAGRGKRKDFYEAVEMCCEAVVEYAAAFASLAEAGARQADTPERKDELKRIAEICRNVPAKPAKTFQEALQSIWFVHLALHASLDMVSLGRLDQLLDPFLQKDISSGRLNRNDALELLECFIIKCAERLNLTSAYLMKQDHLDFGTGLGTNPIFLDQIASANNFLQNLVIGGQTPDGADACNECTLLFLDAYRNIGMPTPTLAMRLHRGMSDKVREQVALTLREGGCGLPVLYNDEAIVPAFIQAGIPERVARDYAVDGCWEPILNGCCDWTFGSVNMLTILECALNRGCAYSNDESLLTGRKLSWATPPPGKLKTFEELLKAFEHHVQFFTDKIALQTYAFYSIDGSVTPTPMLSALIAGCLQKGVDKSWGGADYIVGGVMAGAVPNCANALASLKTLVFEQRKYTLAEVVDNLKSNFQTAPVMREDFANVGPKFGNADRRADEIMSIVLDTFERCVQRSASLAERVFVSEAAEGAAARRIEDLRNLCSYSGPSVARKYGDGFRVRFVTGLGTFGQYSFQGKGVGASADGRSANEPIAPNCSPCSGTARKGLGNALKSYEGLRLSRFAAGAVMDAYIDAGCAPDQRMLCHLQRVFEEYRGNILTVSVAPLEELMVAHEVANDVAAGRRKVDELRPYAQLCVRVGGWNASFVSLPRVQREDYLKRVFTKDLYTGANGVVGEDQTRKGRSHDC
jgi:pyruvate-formate lyase